MKLQEIYESKLQIEEGKKDKNVLATLRFTAAQAEAVNRNKRRYGKDVLERAARKFNEKIKKQKVTGILSSLDHSKDAALELSKVSHLVSRVWMDGDVLRGEAKILNTSKGRDALTILKSGKIGVSMKGFGTSEQEEGVAVIQPGYELAQVDFVAAPSFDVATVSADNIIGESANSLLDEEEEEYDVDVDQFETMVEFETAKHFRIESELNPAMKGTQEEFKEYKRENESFFRKTLVKALIENGYSLAPEIKKAQDEALSGAAEALIRKESEVFGMTGEEYDEALKAGERPSEDKMKYLEARDAGFEGTFEDYKERVLRK